jgi:hypothetical protein
MICWLFFWDAVQVSGVPTIPEPTLKLRRLSLLVIPPLSTAAPQKGQNEPRLPRQMVQPNLRLTR